MVAARARMSRARAADAAAALPLLAGSAAAGGLELVDVTFKPGTALGLRLAPLGAGLGAAFDGWSERKQSSGEGHDMVEVGDRLVAVHGRMLGAVEDFYQVARAIEQAAASVQSEFDAEKLQAELSRSVFQMQSKYDVNRSAVSSKRLVLTFAKPSGAVTVLVDAQAAGAKASVRGAPAVAGHLGAWFRPKDSILFGARFVHCSTVASDPVLSVFRHVAPGQLLVALNGRSVEGLPFHLVVDGLATAKLPLVLRFVDMEEERPPSASERQQQVARDALPELTGLTELTDDRETAEPPSGSVSGLGAGAGAGAGTGESRLVAVAKSQDAYRQVTGVPFTRKHLERFFQSIAEGDRAYFVSRLQSGQDMSVRDALGRTPLVVAAALRPFADAVFFARHLLAEGAPVDDVDLAQDATAMHVAAAAGNVELLAVLRSAGGDINHRDARGHQPLAVACFNGRAAAAARLLELGAAPDAVVAVGGEGGEGSGWSALHMCAQAGRDDMLELLLATGRVDIHRYTRPAPFREPRSALDIAREAGNARCAQILHERAAAEPLQLVWPRGADWVVADATLAVPDLPWREGGGFEAAAARELAQRERAAERTERHRRLRPHGRHDPRAVAAREQALFPDKAPRSGAELWLGGPDAVSYPWAVQRKQLQCVMLVIEDGADADAVVAANPWLQDDDVVELFLVPFAPLHFKDFSAEVLAPALRVLSRWLDQEGKRVLIAAVPAPPPEPEREQDQDRERRASRRPSSRDGARVTVTLKSGGVGSSSDSGSEGGASNGRGSESESEREPEPAGTSGAASRPAPARQHSSRAGTPGDAVLGALGARDNGAGAARAASRRASHAGPTTLLLKSVPSSKQLVRKLSALASRKKRRANEQPARRAGSLDSLNRSATMAALFAQSDEPPQRPKLQYPVAIAVAWLIVRHEHSFHDAWQRVAQNIYFYSEAGAKRKRDQLFHLPKGRMTEEELCACRIAHDVELDPSRRRAALSPDWIEGLQALEDRFFDRKLHETRRNSFMFQATFVL